ncbi:WYL domain-containing protein [Roseibaca sp. V10]|uniref:WYL domain-containing protein n=1 Tax=Roseinatronobacter domitianus TaxID=2940293 RepID=A0ABT0M658_9RHOB|nr:WYL domain-containing protein [Roseibaca domitiana]MCL1630128.1 WYL domain-containing protein [Roseibaca domitiana]
MLDLKRKWGQHRGESEAPMRYARTTDLITLALRMQGTAEGVSLADIMQDFEVSRRTAERMRDALLDALPQIVPLGEPGGVKRWRLPARCLGGMTQPTLDEIAAIHRAREIVARQGDGATAEALDGLATRLKAALPAPARARLAPDITALLEADGVALRPGPREMIAPQTLQTLRNAILAGVWVNVDHRARASGKLSRDVWLGPLAMLMGEGRQYLVAWSDYQEDVRLFALAGFERIELSDEVFERPADFDLQAYLGRAFGVFQEEVQDVVWRFTPDAAPEARRFLFHPTQEMEETHDGSLIVRFRAGGMLEMCWHLFRWGDQVEVLAPEELRGMHFKSLNIGTGKIKGILT